MVPILFHNEFIVNCVPSSRGWTGVCVCVVGGCWLSDMTIITLSVFNLLSALIPLYHAYDALSHFERCSVTLEGAIKTL